MTSDEIVKALRHCATVDGSGCYECPARDSALNSELDCDVLMETEAADLIERLTAENVALREKQLNQLWKPVFAGNPERKGCYLVTVNHWLDGTPVVREAFWNGVDWLSCERRHEITPRVTHWMPLPETPEAAEEGEKA